MKKNHRIQRNIGLYIKEMPRLLLAVESALNSEGEKSSIAESIIQATIW